MIVRLSLEKSRCVLSSKLTSTRTDALLAIEMGEAVALSPGSETREACTVALITVTLGSFKLTIALPVVADGLQTRH